jgi:hypothetical protein
VQIRIVWKGDASTTLLTALSVGSLAELSNAKEMETHILSLTAHGLSDYQIASQLTARGYRSPMRSEVLPSTVKTIRLKHRILQTPSQSHPRRIPGYLTIPQLAKLLDIKKHWIYDRIHNGCIQMTQDAQTGLFLFPDHPDTVEQFKQLKNGQLSHLRSL